MIDSQQVANWKLVGSLLKVRPGQLDIFENDCNNKAEKCCMAMLTYWCNVNPNASLEILKSVVRKSNSLAIPIQTSESVSVVDSIRIFLQDYYDQHRSQTIINLRLPYKPENFANIAFIHHESTEVTEESVTAVANVLSSGDIIIDNKNADDYSSQPWQQNEYYNRCTKDTNVIEFLHNIDSAPEEQGPFLLLIEGRPGVGKTAVCKEIAFQWSKYEKNYLTLLICLHETSTQDINSVDTLFDYVCPGNQRKVWNNVSEYLISKVNKKVMVIIDGYEEVLKDTHSNGKRKTFINDIIKFKILQFAKCDLVISTRCATAVLDELDISQHKNIYRIELLGFTEELQQKYFECNIDQTRSNRDVAKMMKYLSAKPFVKGLCFHPLFISLLVHFYNQSEALPKFQSELIDKFAGIMILWAQQYQKMFNMFDITISHLFERLPENLQITLHKICNWAFDTLQQEIVTTESEHLDDHTLIEKLSYQTGFSYFKVLEKFRGENKVVFHFSIIQEILAAFFLTKSGKDLKNLWSKTEWNHRYITVWAYYFELNKGIPKDLKSLLLLNSWFKQTEKLSSKILLNKVSCIYLVYCLMELPEEGIYQQAKEVVLMNEKSIDINNCKHLTNESVNIIISFLSRYSVRQWENLSLSRCSLDDNKLDNLCQLFLHSRDIPTIDTLDLSSNQFTMKSITYIFSLAHIINASKVILSHNDKVKDKDICRDLVSYTDTPLVMYNLKAVENGKTYFLFGKIGLCHLQSMTTLTALYIIRCLLDERILSYLLNTLKTHELLSLLYLYDNNILYNELLKVFEELRSSKHLTSVLIFEKLLSDDDIENTESLLESTNFILSQVLLVNANKLLAQGATYHQILRALEYNPLTVHLQLNDCLITDEVLNEIAVTLNVSSQHLTLLDLSNNKICDENLQVLCNALDVKCKVASVKLCNNHLNSLTVIGKLIYCLNSDCVDISENGIAVDNGRVLMLTEKFFACERELSLSLSCDKDKIMICHKVDQISLATILKDGNFTQIFLSNCNINEAFVNSVIQNCKSLVFLHLQNVQCYEDIFFPASILEKQYLFTFSVYESCLSDETVGKMMDLMDSNVVTSVIISSDDVFMAHNCSYEILKLHMMYQLPSMSLRLFYISKCLLNKHCKQIEDYLSSKNLISKLVLCKNSMNVQLNKLIDVIKQKHVTETFICEDSLNCNHTVQQLSCSSLMLVGSQMVIGVGASKKQITRATSLISPSMLVIRMIMCNFTCNEFVLLVNSLHNCKNIQEFMFCKSNLNDHWGYRVLEAIQNTCTIKVLCLMSSDITISGIDSVATALAVVISNNEKLEKLTVVFNKLIVTASVKILKAISEISSLKQLLYYNSKGSAVELAVAIANNPGLEDLRLNNNDLQVDVSMKVSDVINKLSKLKILSIVNNGTAATRLAAASNSKQLQKLCLQFNNLISQDFMSAAEKLQNITTLTDLVISDNVINEEASDCLASLINVNKNLRRLHLDNNSLRTAEITKICAVLRHNSTLHVLNLKGNKFDCIAADDIAAVITNNKLLETINLSGNELQTMGVITVAKALRKLQGLKHLDLSKNCITEDVADYLAAIIASNTGIEKLRLCDNALKSAGVSKICTKIIKHVSKLRVLRISNNLIQKGAAEYIAKVIICNPLLEVIDIGNNMLYTEGVTKITNAISKLHCVKELHLSKTCITSEAMDSVVAAVSSNKGLQRLNLDTNHLNSIGICRVCNILKHFSTLRMLYFGSNRMTKSVAGDVAEVILNNPFLVNVGFGNNQLRTEGVKIICNALKQIHHLTVLSLDNNHITEEAANDIALAISSNTRLEKLWLNNNILGEKGINIICKSLKHINTLKLLQIENNKITKGTTREIANVGCNNPLLETLCIGGNNFHHSDMNKLLCALSCNKQLRVLNLNNNKITDNVANNLAVVITENTKLEDLQLKGNSFNGKGVRMIASALKENGKLKVLHFSECEITEEATDAVAAVIMKNPSLENIYLGKSRLQKEVLIDICNSLKKIHHIKELTLNDNDCSDRVVDKIAKVIVNNRGLEKLWLLNDNLTDTGIAKISSAFIEVNILKVFHVANNNISEEAADDIATIFKKCPMLESIDLGYNKLKSEGVIKIANVLKDLSHLRVITLNNNHISDAAADDIAEVISKNDGLEQLWLNNNNLMSSGIKTICKSLKQITVLKLLQLESNQITKEAAGDIASVVTYNPLIQCLFLGNNKLQTEGAVEVSLAISNISHLKSLSLNGNQITEDAAVSIAAAIMNNRGLEKLWLFNNRLADKGVAIIANALKSINTLNTLHIENNSVTGETTDSENLTTVIINNPSLEKVYLGYNYKRLHLKHTLKLCCALKKVSQLKELSLSDNGLSVEAANEIGEVASNNVNLKKLWLNDNNLRDVGVIKVLLQLRQLSDIRLIHLENNYITEKAAESIAEVINNNPFLESISIGNNSLMSKGVIKISNALRSLLHLKQVGFHNNGITEDAANDIAEAINDNSKLEHIWLNNNKLKLEGINRISNALQNLHTLKLLELSDNGITTQAADGIATVINNNPLLQTVALGNNKLETEGVIKIANALKNIKALRVLGLDKSGITDKAANAIADAIHSNTKLEKLLLNGNNLQSNGIKVICENARHIKSFKVLLLQNNSITEEAADDLAAMIINNPLLENFDVSNNKIRSIGLIKVVQALKTVSCLKVLSINGTQITDDVAKDIARIITKNLALEKVLLSNNRLRENTNIITNALQLLDSLRLLQLEGNCITVQAADDIAAVINNNPSLQIVALGNNKLEAEGVIKIANALKNIKDLKVLGLDDNGITDKAANAIADVIDSNTELEKLFLNDNNIQSNGAKVICNGLMHNANLKALQLENNFITEEAAEDLALVIINSPLLEQLFLGNNRLLSKGVSLLSCSFKKIYRLKHLSIDGNSVTEDAADDIAEMIISNCNLEKLWLNTNSLKLAGVNKISITLQYLHTLKLLELSNNGITVQAADGVAAVIINNPLLQTVALGKNKLEAEGVIKIANALKNIRDLKVLGLNDNGITDKAANAIADVIHSNTELEKLLLNDNNLQSNGIKVMCENARHIKSFKVLLLQNNSITEEAADDLAAMIINNPLLENFDVSNNKMRSIGLIKVVQALKTVSCLKVLSINSVQITDDAAKDIAHIITKNLALEKVLLSNNRLRENTNIITNALQLLDSLRLLQLEDNCITVQAADGIAAVINNNPLLRIVFLGKNKLEAEGVIKIANALKNISDLKVLGLDNNGITDKAANAIADVIYSNTELEMLFLNDNNLQSNGAKIICKSLMSNKILKLLLLQSNLITEEAADDLTEMIINISLPGTIVISNKSILNVNEVIESQSSKVLHLNNSQITDDVANDIAQAIATNCTLVIVHLCNNKLNLAGIVTITNALQQLNTLKLLKLDGNYITTQAADGIAAVINNNLLLQIVSLGNNKLGTEGVIKIAKALRNLKHLNMLGLDDNGITDKAANAIADVIHSNTELEELLLNDNNLQSNGMKVICENARHIKSFKVLLLQNNSITEEAADDLAAMIINNPLLENFDVSNNKMRSIGLIKVVQALKTVSCLKVLSINSVQITDDAAKDIAHVITINLALEKVLLSNNRLRENTNIITNALQLLDSLRLLQLEDNCITVQAADGIAAVINNNPSLQIVFLGKNKLEAEGVIKIANALKNIRDLKVLGLDDNGITDKAANAIADVIHSNTELEELLLNDNNLQSNGIKVICENARHIKSFKVLLLQNNSITEEAADDLAAMIINNPLLENFDVSNNKMRSIGLIKVVQALKTVSCLKVLSINSVQITDDAAKDIAHIITKNLALEKVLLSNNRLRENTNIITNALQLLDSLRLLQLEDNCITVQAADGIAAVINNNPLLRIVFLGKNKLEAEGVIKIANALKNIRDLKVLGLDDNGITDKAANAIADVIYSNTELEMLFLNDNSLQSNGMIVICKSLMNIKSIKVLQFESNSITEEAADDIALVIKNNPLLEIFVLSDNKLGSKGVIIICCSLKQLHHLKILCLNINLITEEASGVIAEVIYGNCELASINLAGNKLKFCSQNTQFDISFLFIKNSTLQKLFLNHCLLKSSEATHILCSLKKPSAIIKVLKLNSNCIMNRCGIADDIAQIMLRNGHIEKFYISCNRLQATGITTILQSLKQTHSLNELSLGSNDIIEDISNDMVDVITNNPRLEVLEIDYTCIHSEGAAKVIRSLKLLSHLKLLDMPGNNVSKEAANDIAITITNNSNLVRLYIADNYLGAVGITKITEAFANPRGLEVLDLTSNNITTEGAKSIAKVILANSSLESLLLGEGHSQMKNAMKPKILETNSSLCDPKPLIKLNEVLLFKQMLRIKEKTKIYGPLYPFYCTIVDATIDCFKVYGTSQNKFTFHSASLLKCNYNSLQSNGVKEICKAFACTTSLKVLSIENNEVDDEATNDMVAALTSNTGIKQLWIGENHFTPNGISVILQPLIQQFMATFKSTLEVLDLSYTNVTLKETADNILIVVSSSNEIKQLWLEGNNLSSQSITTMANALKKCRKLLVLSLRNNNICDGEGDVLSEALSGKSNLQQLYLGNNQLEDRGVIKMTEALNTIHGLLTLDLMNNNISEVAADALATVITSCRLLEQLYLGDNKLRSTGAIKIAIAIQQAACRSTLRVLDLSNNGIGSDERVADEISRAVGNTELLTVLILDDNALSVDGLLKITRSLGQSESAEYMMIFSVMRNDVMISEEAKDEMTAVMADQQLTDCVMYF